MTTMKIGDQTVIIQGQGNCSVCGRQFLGEPFDTFTAMKNHERTTGHDVWNGKPMNEDHELVASLMRLGVVLESKVASDNKTIIRILQRLRTAKIQCRLTAKMVDKSIDRISKL